MVFRESENDQAWRACNSPLVYRTGSDSNRLIIGTLDPKFPNSTNESELVQDRIVRFTLVTTGGR